MAHELPALPYEMNALEPRWLAGCRLRACGFEPTFHKHHGKLCTGFQVHADGVHAVLHHRV